MFDRGPMTIRLISPRSTAPYHTLDSSSRITSPITVAPGTTHALEWMVGPFFKRAVIPACPVGSVSGSMCIQDLTFNIVRSASNAEFWVTGQAIHARHSCRQFPPLPLSRGEDRDEGFERRGRLPKPHPHPPLSLKGRGDPSSLRRGLRYSHWGDLEYQHRIF